MDPGCPLHGVRHCQRVVVHEDGHEKGPSCAVYKPPPDVEVVRTAGVWNGQHQATGSEKLSRLSGVDHNVQG